MSGKRKNKNKQLNVVDNLMSSLIVNRNFQKLWQDEVIDIINSQQELEEHSNYEDEILKTALSIDANEASLIIDNLNQNIHLAIETFLRSLPLAQINSDEKLSRESASLYSVRVQIDRLTLNNNLQLPQLRLAARRINHLLKDFTICISKPFPLNSCSFLASTLCDLLYRFEELCSMNDDIVPSIPCQKLRRTIDDFHYDIVKRLNTIFLQRRPTTSVTTTSGLGTSYHSLSNLSSLNRSQPVFTRGSVAAMAPTIIFQKTPTRRQNTQKSFLLPADLEEARNRLKRSRSITIRNSKIDNNSRKLIIDQIENKWKNLLSDDFIKSFESKSPKNDEGAESRAALKAACKLTRDVVEEISRRVDKL